MRYFRRPSKYSEIILHFLYFVPTELVVLVILFSIDIMSLTGQSEN